jgi:hypothetical protein
VFARRATAFARGASFAAREAFPERAPSIVWLFDRLFPPQITSDDGKENPVARVPAGLRAYQCGSARVNFICRGRSSFTLSFEGLRPFRAWMRRCDEINSRADLVWFFSGGHATPPELRLRRKGRSELRPLQEIARRARVFSVVARVSPGETRAAGTPDYR